MKPALIVAGVVVVGFVAYAYGVPYLNNRAVRANLNTIRGNVRIGRFTNLPS